MRTLFITLLLFAFTGITYAQMNMGQVAAYIKNHQGRINTLETEMTAAELSVTSLTDGSTDIVLTTTSPTIWNLAGPVSVVITGTDVACDDGDRHITEIMVSYTTTATGIFYLVGSVGGTDSVVCELFDATGTLVTGGTTAASATAAGDIVGTAAEFQMIPFTGGPILLSPGRYFVSAQFDGTTAKYRAPLVPGVPYTAITTTGVAWTPASVDTLNAAGAGGGAGYTNSEGIYGGIY